MNFAFSQNEFYEKHMDTFDENDENKLEYTQIYEAYVLISETLIEAELQKDYSQDQIQKFYDHFKENLKDYEALSPETVDTLYAFIDFDVFKKAMLRYKSDIHKAQTNTTAAVGNTTDFKIDIDAFNRFQQEDPTNLDSGWKQGFIYPE